MRKFSLGKRLRDCGTARLRDCETTGLRDCEAAGLRDCGTMTCDYDNDHFNQELNFSIPVKAVIVIVNSHSQ